MTDVNNDDSPKYGFYSAKAEAIAGCCLYQKLDDPSKIVRVTYVSYTPYLQVEYYAWDDAVFVEQVGKHVSNDTSMIGVLYPH